MVFEGGAPKNRVICLVDVDSFEVQVYDKLFPEFINLPRVVANSGRGGRMVAVSYEAKAMGVKRTMNVSQALKLCPDLKVIYKETKWGKPDAKTPRHASWKIFDAIHAFAREMNITLEYASSDEFYLDLTNQVNYRMENKTKYTVQSLGNCFYLEGGTRMFKDREIRYRLNMIYPDKVLKYEKEERLIYGGIIAQELCHHIYQSVGYVVSAGVSSNKLMAKLACPLHKPGGLTVLPRAGLDRVSSRIAIENIPGLGGLCGQKIKNNFNVKTMKDLRQISMGQLRGIFDADNAARFYDLAQGLCDDVVVHKIMKDEVCCSKSRIGRAFGNKLLEYLLNLAGEMMERLQEEKIRHKRTTRFLQIKCEYWKKAKGALSFTFDISKLRTQQKIAEKAYAILAGDSRTENYAINNLKLTAKNFN